MEPNDLKSPAPDDAQLEAWLRASSSLPSLPDDGFSRRVLTMLPPPRRRFPARLVACLIGGLAGVLVAARPVLTAGSLLDALPAIDAALLNVFEQFASPAMGIALAATVGSLLYVFWSELRRFARR